MSLVSIGNEKAFKALFDRFSKNVYSKAFLILKNPAMAEDVIQEVFIKLWLNREKIADIHDFKAYLNVLTRNHVFNLLRKQAYHEKFIGSLTHNESVDNKTAFESMLISELHERIHQVISSLPPQQKRVYELSRSEGLKHSDIARQLGISAETVKKHLSEAMRTLKKKLIDFNMVIFLFSVTQTRKK
jgi:RNA polymerase sigma-70 factor (family 1)